MAITYQTGSKDLHDAVYKTMGKFHGELAEAEVTIGVLYAYNDSGEPAVKCQGYACEAKIKINSLQDRVEGKPDATMTIDGKLWKEDLTDDQRLAIIDHELQHLEVQRDEEGQIKADDIGRPKLKIRLHDWQIGGFEVTAARHKQASAEVRQAKVLRDQWGQLLWDFDDAPAREQPLPMETATDKAASTKKPTRRRPKGSRNQPRA